jgi:acyl-coenzyme A synthetase/AMP-(fatty) acid ligase
MHVVDMVFYWAKVDPHRLALIQPEMVTSYQALANAIEAISERIDQLSLERAEPLAVSLANPSYFIATVFAVLRSGYSAALVNPGRYPLLPSAGIRNLIYDIEGQVLSGGRNIRFDRSWLPSATSGAIQRSPRPRITESGNIIVFTSGTTGLPKKIIQAGTALDQLLRHPFTCASGPHQRILVIPGVTSTFGFNRVCEILNVGKTACFAPDSMSALSLISLFDIGVVVASAQQALNLVEAERKCPGYKLDSLKTVYIGGGNIAADGIAAVRSRLCRNVVNQYGSTEGGLVAVAPFDLIADRPGGFVFPWVQLEIVDEAGNVLPAGTEGLVRYRTPQLNENLKIAGADGIPNVRDGWFYPGDVGSLTAEGLLYLAGRKSDVINRGGVKVSGTRIEEILTSMPEIKEAAACGVAGPSGLEEIWIAVVANGSPDTEAIKIHLRDHADVGVAPDEVFVLDALPRGEHGKVQKYRLKELLLKRKRAA